MSEPNPTDAFDEEEATTARWRAAFNDPEFMDALMAGVPKHSPDWWQVQPGENAVAYMFRIFPLAGPLQ